MPCVNHLQDEILRVGISCYSHCEVDGRISKFFLVLVCTLLAPDLLLFKGIADVAGYFKNAPLASSMLRGIPDDLWIFFSTPLDLMGLKAKKGSTSCQLLRKFRRLTKISWKGLAFKSYIDTSTTMWGFYVRVYQVWCGRVSLILLRLWWRDWGGVHHSCAYSMGAFWSQDQ